MPAVQGPQNIAGYKSTTELMRAIAQHSGWRFDAADQLVDAAGAVIATSIEDAAAAADQLRWYVSDPDGVETTIYWAELPVDLGDRAEAIRQILVAA